MVRPEESNIADLLEAVNRCASAFETSAADMDESNRVADQLIVTGTPDWGHKVVLCRTYFRLSRCGANGEPELGADLVDRLVWSLLNDTVFEQD